VSLVVGADEAPTLDNLVISQVISSSWQNLAGTGTATKTSTGTVSVAAATTYFAFGYNTLAVVYISGTGSDASSGQNTTNVPVGTGPKLTMNGALAAVAEGGTIQTTAAGTFAGAYTLNKNVNFISGAGAFTISGTGTVTTKAVFPFEKVCFHSPSINPATKRPRIICSPCRKIHEPSLSPSRYSPAAKVQRLPIEAISKASANQRAGRAGRTSPGLLSDSIQRMSMRLNQNSQILRFLEPTWHL
jgi:hypothetical protein